MSDDLVQRLRNGADDVNDEAADHIEYLEDALRTIFAIMPQANGALQKRITELEEHKRAQAEDIMTLGMTVGRLEAALREIAENSKEWSANQLSYVAHAALEGKE